MGCSVEPKLNGDRGCIGRQVRKNTIECFTAFTISEMKFRISVSKGQRPNEIGHGFFRFGTVSVKQATFEPGRA